MSNLTIFKDKNPGVPSTRRGLTPLAQSLARPGNNMRQIQTNTNGTFRRVVGGEPVGAPARGELDVIIVNTLPNVSRQYYATEYDPSAAPTLPDCWSDDGKKPSPRAKSAQSALCDICPQNVVGSGKNGGRACRYKRNLAVIVVNDPNHEVYRLSVPATSLFGDGVGNSHPFESYIRYLIANHESPDNVVTNVSYDINSSTMKLVFTPVRFISDEEAEAVAEAQKSDDARNYVLVVGDDVTSAAPPITHPTHVEQNVKPEQRSRDVSAEEEGQPKSTAGFFGAQESATEVPAPTVRRGRPPGSKNAPKEPTAMSDIKTLINQWENDD